jgi:hypothetical protein
MVKLRLFHQGMAVVSLEYRTGDVMELKEFAELHLLRVKRSREDDTDHLAAVAKGRNAFSLFDIRGAAQGRMGHGNGIRACTWLE